MQARDDAGLDQTVSLGPYPKAPWLMLPGSSRKCLSSQWTLKVEPTVFSE